MILRELTGDIYFGEPRGSERVTIEWRAPSLQHHGLFGEAEVERIAHVAFQCRARRRRKVCSVDKANVLETSKLWRDVVNARWQGSIRTSSSRICSSMQPRWF